MGRFLRSLSVKDSLVAFCPWGLEGHSPCGQTWGPEHRSLNLKEHCPPASSWAERGMLLSFQVEIHVDLYSGPAVFLGECPSACAWLRRMSSTVDPVIPRAVLVALLWWWDPASVSHFWAPSLLLSDVC